MVTHQPKDGHPQEGRALQSWNSALTDFKTKLTSGDNCHGWSPSNPRMVVHQKEVYYRLAWYRDLLRYKMIFDGVWHWRTYSCLYFYSPLVPCLSSFLVSQFSQAGQFLVQTVWWVFWCLFTFYWANKFYSQLLQLFPPCSAIVLLLYRFHTLLFSLVFFRPGRMLDTLSIPPPTIHRHLTLKYKTASEGNLVDEIFGKQFNNFFRIYPILICLYICNQVHFNFQLA